MQEYNKKEECCLIQNEVNENTGGKYITIPKCQLVNHSEDVYMFYVLKNNTLVTGELLAFLKIKGWIYLSKINNFFLAYPTKLFK